MNYSYSDFDTQFQVEDLYDFWEYESLSCWEEEDEER